MSKNLHRNLFIEKEDNIGPKELIDSFKKVQHIFEIVKICAKSKLVAFKYFHTVDYLPFKEDYVGEKVKKEIRSEIKKNENLLKPLGERHQLAAPLKYMQGDLEGHNWSQVIANLLGSLSWLTSPHHQVIDITRRTQENFLEEIKKYLLNELR